MEQVVEDQGQERIDRASRIILASPRILFRACLDREALLSWRVPDGMAGEIMHFDARIDGGYAMVLRHDGADAASHGKTAPGEDRVEVRFLEIAPEELIDEEVRFMSDDPAFADPMHLAIRFTPVRGGTKVSLEARCVPDAIDPQDHRAAMEASLRKLALLAE